MNKALTARQYLYSRYLSVGTIAIIIAISTGCASIAPKNTAASSSTRNPYQEKISINGRLQVQYQQEGKEQSLPGNFEWLQNETDTSINLLSPLGQTIAIIKQDATGASLQQADHPTKLAADVDTLVGETLGWPLPLLGMRDWLQGYTRDKSGRHVAVLANNSELLTADGWQLRYVSWQETAGQTYPKRIDLHRYTTQAGDVNLRIVMDQWKAP